MISSVKFRKITLHDRCRLAEVENVGSTISTWSSRRDDLALRLHRGINVEVGELWRALGSLFRYRCRRLLFDESVAGMLFA